LALVQPYPGQRRERGDRLGVDVVRYRLLALPQPDQQREREQAADQVPGDDRRLQQKRHGPHSEQALEDDGCQQRARQPGRLAQPVAQPPALHRDRDDQHAQHDRDVAVAHLAPGLGHGDRAQLSALLRNRGRDLGVCLGRQDLAVAAWPIGTTESGVTETHVGAEHDQAQRQHRGESDQALVAQRGVAWCSIHVGRHQIFPWWAMVARGSGALIRSAKS
jgi:hypothetical protein